MRHEIRSEGAARRGKFISGEMRTCGKHWIWSPSRVSSPLQIFGQTCGVKRREEGLEMGRRMSKKEKRLLLTILERSAVARATRGTRDWYLKQRSSGIAAEDLMFGAHLASTNTLHLFSSFPDTLPASSLQPYRQTPRGRRPIFFYCLALVLREPQAVV